MGFLEELVNAFLVVLLIACLFGLFTISFYGMKKFTSLVMTPETFVSSFFMVKNTKEKNDKSEEKKTNRNRLYLLLLLNNYTTNTPTQISRLNKLYRNEFRNLLEDPLMIENIERGIFIFGTNKLKSIGVFKLKSLYNHLSEDQVIELEKTERFLYKMGINVYSNCNLDEELGLILTKITLTELFDKIAKIKKATGKNSKEAFDLVKTKPDEYLRGILEFNLGGNQINSTGNTKDIYTRINEKTVDRISFDGAEPNQTSTSFELPLSESLGMKAFTIKTLKKMNDDRNIKKFKNLTSQSAVKSKPNKQSKKKNSKP